MQYLVNLIDEWKLSSQTVRIFVWYVITAKRKKRLALVLFLENITSILLVKFWMRLFDFVRIHLG